MTEYIGDYEIIETLADHPHSSVYKVVRENREGRPATLKLFATDNLSLKTFEHEKSILQVLNCAGIPPLIDTGLTDKKQPYLVTEFAAGRRITDFANHHKQTINQRVTTFLKLCTIVTDAHKHAVIHRDLKPSHALVDQLGNVSLLDFGASYYLDDFKETDYKTQGYTPSFAAPELITGKSATVATDVYGLGRIFYLLLCDDHPFDFDGKSNFEIESTVLGEMPFTPARRFALSDQKNHLAQNRQTTPTQLTKQLQGDLQLIVMKAIDADPKQRYASVAEFVDDLNRYLAHEPISARPADFSYVTKQFYHRNRVLSLLSILIIGIFISTIGISLWQKNKAALAQSVAEHQREQTDLMSGFMLNLLTDPSAGGLETPVLSVLHRASAQLDTALIQQPAVRSDLMLNFAAIYTELADYEKAETLLRYPIHFHNTISYLKSLKGLGSLNRIQGNYDIALSYFQKVDSLIQIAPSVPDSLILGSYTNQAVLFYFTSEVDGADSLYQLALAFAENNLNIQDRSRASLLADYAGFNNQIGDYPLSIQTHHEALNLRRRTFGEQSTAVASSYNNLGTTFFNDEKLDSALYYYRQSLKIRKNILGDHHPDVANVYNNLGATLSQLQRYDEVDSLYQLAFDIYDQTLGPTHVETISMQNNIAVLAYRRDNFEGAAAQFEKIVNSLVGNVPENDIDLAFYRMNLAGVYRKLEQYNDALLQSDQALKSFLNVLPADHPYVKHTVNGLIEAYIGLDDMKAARETNNSDLDRLGREDEFKERYAGRLISYSNFLFDQEDYQTAQPFLEESLSLWPNIPEPDSNLIGNNHFLLGSIYQKQKRPDQAEASFNESLRYFRLIHSQDTSKVLAALSN